MSFVVAPKAGTAGASNPTPGVPGSSTDNAIPRWNGTTGVSIQNSAVIVDDSNNMLFPSGGDIGTSSGNKVGNIFVTNEVSAGGFRADDNDVNFTCTTVGDRPNIARFTNCSLEINQSVAFENDGGGTVGYRYAFASAPNDNGALYFTAVDSSHNDITVTLHDNSTFPETVSVVGHAITVHMDGNDNSAQSSINSIKAALLADAGVTALIGVTGGGATAGVTGAGPYALTWHRPSDILASQDVEIGRNFTTSSNASIATAADVVKFGGYDIAAGRRTLALGTEEAVAVDVVAASTHTLTVRINGVNYKILLST